MRTFSEVRFEEPGYPIIKAFIVPYREGNKVLHVRRVKQEDIEVWRDVLNRLKEFLSESLKFARQWRKNLSLTEELELTSDLIALFFKIPLVREILPATAPNPIKIYLLYRLLGFQEEVTKPIELVERAYSREITKRLNELTPVATFSDTDLSEKIEHCWFVLPADTRPSLNTAGLLPHLLLTSALVWAEAVVTGLSNKDAAILRLSAMLHDMGKPFRYADHVMASLEVAEILLEGTSYLNEVKEFILKHHKEAETEEAKILSEADEIAASMDRLTELSKKIIGGKIYELSAKAGLDSNDVYSSGVTGWKFWQEIYRYDESSIENLSKEFVEGITSKMEEYTRLIEAPGGKVVKNIEIGLIDVGEIQSFVFRSEELKVVTAASLTIDTLVMAQMPLMIQQHVLRDRNIWFPYEAILYSAGGVLEMILPSFLSSVIEEVCKKVEDVPVRFASTPLSTNHSEAKQNLAKKIQEKKFQIRTEERAVKISVRKGIRSLCELCYLNPPVEKIKTPDGEKNVCDRCSKLYEIGFELHFRAKYESEITAGNERFTPRQVFGMSWEGEADKWIIELISGHDKKELDEGARLRNLGVVKVDGNLMGTCLSPADAYERSARIDLALKKAIEYAVKALFEGVFSISKDREEAARAAASVKLGLLYAGGDDGLFFMPSWCVLPFTIILGQEFSTNLGNARGLAMGGIASPARSSVWALVSAASRLMEEAKVKARGKPSLSLLCFDVVESGTLSDSTAESRLESLREQFLSSQPYEVNDLFKNIINGYSSDSEAFGKCYILSRFPKLCNDNQLKEEVEKNQKRVKQIRSAINSTLLAARSHVESGEYIPVAAFFYAKRQEARMGESSAYTEILKLIPRKFGEKTQLADADRLIKFVGGGVL